MYIKNTANQWVGFSQISRVDGSPVVGANPGVAVALDGGSQVGGAGTILDLGNGQYWYGLTQGETNCDFLTVVMFSTSTVEVEKTILPFDALHPPPSLVGPQGHPGPTGATGPAGPTGPAGTTSLVIGSAVTGGPVAGGVLWTTSASPPTVAQAAVGNFQYDPDGTYGPFTTPFTLYIGDFAGATAGGILGLYDAGLAGGCPLQVFDGTWYFGVVDDYTGGSGNFGGSLTVGGGGGFGGLVTGNGFTSTANITINATASTPYGLFYTDYPSGQQRFLQVVGTPTAPVFQLGCQALTGGGQISFDLDAISGASITLNSTAALTPSYRITNSSSSTETGVWGTSPDGSTISGGIVTGLATGLPYTVGDAADWTGSPPTTVNQALDRIAALLVTIHGSGP